MCSRESLTFGFELIPEAQLPLNPEAENFEVRMSSSVMGFASILAEESDTNLASDAAKTAQTAVRKKICRNRITYLRFVTL